jgi:hypothetical protein
VSYYGDQRLALVAILRGQKIPQERLTFIARKGIRPKAATYLLDMVLNDEYLCDAVLFELELGFEQPSAYDLREELREPKERARRDYARTSGGRHPWMPPQSVIDAQVNANRLAAETVDEFFNTPLAVFNARHGL